MLYTVESMKQRQTELEGRESHNDLSLRTAGELDAIRNHGLKAWKEYREKHYKQ